MSIVRPNPYVQIRHRSYDPSPYGVPMTSPPIKLLPPALKEGVCTIIIKDQKSFCTWDELFNAVLDLKGLLPDEN